MQIGSVTLPWLAPLRSRVALKRLIPVLLALPGAAASQANTDVTRVQNPIMKQKKTTKKLL